MGKEMDIGVKKTIKALSFKEYSVPEGKTHIMGASNCNECPV
jgi:hypothetical protein